MAHSRSRAATIGALVVIVAFGSACQDRPSRVAWPAATSTTSTDCVDAVSYWVSKDLAAGTDNGMDYQEMGLSDGEYSIYLTVTRGHYPAAARVMSASDLSHIRDGCAARSARTGTPGTNGHGWPG